METNDTGATPHHSLGSFFAQFFARLTTYLEDGKKAGKHLQPSSASATSIGDEDSGNSRLVLQP